MGDNGGVQAADLPSFALAMDMARAPRSTAAFDELLSTLTDIRDGYVNAPERNLDELEAVEGFRYAMHLLSEANDLLIEGDTERPRFTSMVTPSRKYLGDNPDAIYFQALIRGDRGYRITGRRDEQCYVSFTVHGADPAGGINGPVLADINDADLDIAEDGTFELLLSPDEQPGTWVRLPSEARYVFVRNYWLQQRSAQNDPDIAVRLHIEPLDDPGPAPALDDATFAARLRDANAFLHAATAGSRIFGAPSPVKVPFVSNEPNSVGTPWSFRNAGVDAAGAVDIFYSSGTFSLEPGQALVMDGTLPPSRFTNVMLWNVHMQTLEYRSRRSSLNSAQMVTDADGHYRIVISATDPGVPNWLDTGGHRRGTIFWRFLLPEHDPETPRCRVVPVGQLAG
jgi:hypothetical protein